MHIHGARMMHLYDFGIPMTFPLALYHWYRYLWDSHIELFFFNLQIKEEQMLAL